MNIILAFGLNLSKKWLGVICLVNEKISKCGNNNVIEKIVGVIILKVSID